MRQRYTKYLELAIDFISTEYGNVTVFATDDEIKAIDFSEQKYDINRNGMTALAIDQLSEYFFGTRRVFDLPINPDGTEFQKKVWDQLLKVKHGEISTYLGVAKQIGNPMASRAVGLANGKNPIPIIIPCHRIIGSNGKLTGYACGIERKKYLLNLEVSAE